MSRAWILLLLPLAACSEPEPPGPPPEPTVRVAPAALDGLHVGDPVSGALLYRRHCISCHGEEGRGDGPYNDVIFPPAARDHTDGGYMNIRSDEDGTTLTGATNTPDADSTDYDIWYYGLHVSAKFGIATIKAMGVINDGELDFSRGVNACVSRAHSSH